jgi:SAM-dependent methyltransferase
MDVRRLTRTVAGGAVGAAVADLNARHPWSHNDHFHSWVLAHLPERRRTAVDVGCGRGGLLVALAPYVDRVVGADVDAGMRAVAAARTSDLGHVEVTGTPWTQVDDLIGGPVDLVTMIAVLHHLDVAAALHDVRRLLAPGGRFLCVGLAPPRSALDLGWDLASIVTNPVIGWVKHPWPAPPTSAEQRVPDVPVAQPTLGLGELRELLDEALPGARVRRHLGFGTRSSGPRPADSAQPRSQSHTTRLSHQPSRTTCSWVHASPCQS